MRLNRCGAYADRRFIGIPDSPGRREPQWQLPFGQALELPCSRGSRPVPAPPSGFCESQESGSFEGSPPAREKLLNLHRMKDFRRGSGDVHTSGRMAQPSKPSALTPRRAVRRRQAAVAKPADLSRRPEIMKPAPIGHFVRFSRRARLSPALDWQSED